MAWNDIPDWAENVMMSLLQALRERDPYTYGHCRRVAYNAGLLAKAAGLNIYDQKVVEYSSVFHDLGKIAIPDAVLQKPGRLSPEEQAIIRIHPIKSVEIIQPLTQIPFFKDLIPGILHHHERLDGKGYPDRQVGDEIPLQARIILIADTFDAMTSTRPYRNGLPKEVAYKELIQFSGRQFDEQLVQIFSQAHPTWADYDSEITEEFVTEHFKRAA
ncbi:MAG: HD-GYP domain-containing protein [Proteobacteria bacterium]|nr:MAG: HD-GYP domain-containing protein [Pseudomonadota bacterium]